MFGPDAAYPEQVARFDVGDRVALYTDGLTDAADRNGDPFAPAGLDGGPPATAEATVRRVLGDLDEFTAGQPVADDRTLVVVGRV